MASSSETTKPKASPTKQVNFEEKHDTKFIEKKRRSNPDMYEPHSNPAKIKVRKEDALCHIGAFVSFLVIYFISVLYSTRNSRNTSAKTPSIFADLEKEIQKSYVELDDFVHPPLPEKTMIQVPVSESNIDIDIGVPVPVPVGCSLYIAESSLPNSGFGIYSIKSFQEGDLIIPQSKTFQAHDFDFSPYMLLMKQHSAFDNIKGGVGGSPIIASKDIEEGEELFFNFEDYASELKTAYQKIHSLDPSDSLFGKVDEITQHIVDAVPMKKMEIRNNKRKQYKQKDKKKYVTKPAFDMTPMLQILRDTLEEYDSELSDLLPMTHNEATSIVKAGGRANYISNKRSSLWLSRNGVCVDGVRPPNNDISDGSHGAFTTRSVLKDDVIITSPIYATMNQQDDTNCFRFKAEEDLLLCPLSFASHLNEGLSPSQCEADRREDCPRNVANAYYQWSKFNELNKDIQKLSTSDLLQKPLTGLTIDIIAARDLDQGEEVLLDYSADIMAI
jgi:hypothetical protein